MKIKLAREWTLGEPIAEGGFGQVYQANSADGALAAIKLVPKRRGAQREMLFVDLSGAENVVPILEHGETSDSWVLVMPLAETSLRQHLEREGALSSSAARAILIDIATALASFDGRVVHRDLKPENVLLLDGKWCLADFGISRYAEATTAPDTQKYALSLPYAAPERWRAERATIAADVYSLGVIAFEMIAGELPFPGREVHDFREQHLHQEPPLVTNAPALLASIIGECLYKSPGARPSPANLLTRLQGMETAARSSGLLRLQQANLAEVTRLGAQAQMESQARSAEERRKELGDTAALSLRAISNELFRRLTEAAPTVRVKTKDNDDSDWGLQLNSALIRFSPTHIQSSRWVNELKPVFDVVAFAAIDIRVVPDASGYEGRGHSLWFCDAIEPGQFQWFETAFMYSPLIDRHSSVNPFALTPGLESWKALWGGLAEFQVAWPFEPVALGALDQFADRWMGWFADGTQRKLRHPSMVPERVAEGSWRKK